MRVDGSCHCGKIAFDAEVSESMVVLCHRADCQVFSGSAFRVSVAAPCNGFRLLGTIRQRALLPPTVQIWCRSALGWHGTIGAIPGSPEQQALLHK